MTRIRVSKDFDQRLNELLDTAQELFFKKGYQQVSVNDIIEKVGVAKGTFYHYFTSKNDLLDQLVERFVRQASTGIQEIVKDTELNATEKLNRFIASMRSAKEDNMELMKIVMKVMYTNDNLILRHKMFKRSAQELSPLLSQIISEGVEQGVFSPVDTDEAPAMIFAIGFHCNEEVVQLLLEANEDQKNFDLIERKLSAYERSVERILGAATDSFHVGDRKYIERFRIEKTSIERE